MKNFDLTPFERFLKEQNLTVADLAKKLNQAQYEISQYGMYAIQYAKTDAFNVLSITDAEFTLNMLVDALIDNDLQAFFADKMNPEDLFESLSDAVCLYKDLIEALSSSDNDDAHILVDEKEEYTASQIELLEELTACFEPVV